MLGGLFQDLAFYGITPPKHVEDAIAEKELLSHEVYWILYNFSLAAAFTTTDARRRAQTWLSEKYPDTFDTLYRPLWEKDQQIGTPVAGLLPGVCRSCARSARSRWPSPSRTTRPRSASAQRVPRRDVPHLLRRLPVDLRARAREVRPGVAAGAPDLPGQLRWPDRPRRPGLVRHPGRATAASTRVRSTPTTGRPGTTTQTSPTSDRRPEHHGRQEHRHLRLPVRSRQELYGDDQLVHLWFRRTRGSAPRPLPRSEGDDLGRLLERARRAVAEEDPDFDPAARRVWMLHGEEFEPRDDQTLEEIGVGHKDVIGMRVVA